MSAVNEDGLAILLDRIQGLAIRTSKAEFKAEHLPVKIRDLENDIRRLRADFESAEKKIGEWAEYASQLRAVITPVALKRKNIVLPDMPKPLETYIPF